MLNNMIVKVSIAVFAVFACVLMFSAWDNEAEAFTPDWECINAWEASDSPHTLAVACFGAQINSVYIPRGVTLVSACPVGQGINPQNKPCIDEWSETWGVYVRTSGVR